LVINPQGIRAGGSEQGLVNRGLSAAFGIAFSKDSSSIKEDSKLAFACADTASLRSRVIASAWSGENPYADATSNSNSLPRKLFKSQVRGEIKNLTPSPVTYNSSLIAWVKEIAQSTTHDCMITGLKELSALGKANRDLLEKIGFDFKLFDLASQTADDLDSKYAAGSWKSEAYLEARKNRNQAFTHLKEAVDLIYEYGRYVFWRNPTRLKGYASDHLRRYKKRSTRRDCVPEPEPGYVPITIDS
jgi:hypothetical protein